MNRKLIAIGGICVLTVSVCGAGEIGFLEDFALAKDRAVALEQLIPGTRDYYYYQCLHFQNSGRFDEVDRVLKLWIKRYCARFSAPTNGLAPSSAYATSLPPSFRRSLHSCRNKIVSSCVRWLNSCSGIMTS